MANAPAASRKPAPAEKRTIGRPAGRGIGRTKLIAVACELLKTVPPQQITLALVAAHAGVDPSLIRYYFKDRLTMLASAAELLSERYQRRMNARLRDAAPTAMARLEARLDMIVTLEATYSQFRRLLVDELLHSESRQAHGVARDMILRGVGAYRAIVQDGVADGTLRDEDSIMLFISVVAMSSYFASARSIYEVATGRKISQRAMTKKYRGFVTEWIGRNMAADVPPTPAPSPGSKRATKARTRVR